MKTTTDKPEKTAYHHGDLRTALVLHAVKLIHARGDLNFSLRDLAMEIGVSHVAVYRHFADKAALLNAVAVHGFGLLAQAMRDAGEGWSHDPEQQLVRQGAAYVTMAVRYPGHFAAMFAPQAAKSGPLGQSPEVQAVAEVAYQLLAQTVARRLQAAHLPSANVHTEALRCWALVHGLACLQLSGNLAACLGHDPVNASDEALQTFVAGFLSVSPSLR